MRGKSSGKFDAEEYLRLLQEAGTEKKRGGPPQSPIKTRFYVFSNDPVQNDCIWRAVVRGENAADHRRKIDYGSIHRLYQEPSWLGSSDGSLSLASASSHQDAQTDPFVRRLHVSYGHVTQGPPPPTTSNAVIGWRSSLPELHLERYGNKARRRSRPDPS